MVSLPVFQLVVTGQTASVFTLCMFLLQGNCKEDPLSSYELICSLHSLILSVEQLQASFLLNPEKYTDELATQPRRLLNTLRYQLPYYMLSECSPQVLRSRLHTALETCGREMGLKLRALLQKVRFYCYPYGINSKVHLNQSFSCGFRTVCTVKRVLT